MVPEQWPQGDRKGQRKVINLLGCNGGRDWAVPELPESLVGVWMDWQVLQEIDDVPMNNSSKSKGTWAEKCSEVRHGGVVCYFSHTSRKPLRTISVEVDNRAHLGSKFQLTEKGAIFQFEMY